MRDKAVEEWRGFDPGWADTLLDMVIHMVEAPAEQIVAIVPQLEKMDLEVIDLLHHSASFQLPRRSQDDGVLVWQLRGHSWSQVDISPFTFGADNYSRELNTRVYMEAWDQTSDHYSWKVCRDGVPIADYQPGFGVEQSLTPPDARVPPMPGAKFSPDRAVMFYSEKDYGFQMDRYDEEAKRVRAEILSELGFFVGCFPLYETAHDVLDTYGYSSFLAAFALTRREYRGFSAQAHNRR